MRRFGLDAKQVTTATMANVREPRDEVDRERWVQIREAKLREALVRWVERKRVLR